MELPYDEYKWFSPKFALNYFSKLNAQYGHDKVTKDNKFKKEREAWIVGLALLGINKMTGRLWWLQVPRDDPPDMRVMTLLPDLNNNQNEMHHREIEVAQITKFTNSTIEEEILRKLNNKLYIKETCLLIYMNRATVIDDMRKLAAKLNGKIQVSDVWIMGAVSKDSSKHILFSLHPEVKVQHFDIFEEMDRIPLGDTISLIPRHKGTKLSLIRNVPTSKFIPN